MSDGYWRLKAEGSTLVVWNGISQFSMLRREEMWWKETATDKVR